MRDLLPRAAEKLRTGKRLGQEDVEKWRCLGALERLAPETKERILKALVNQGQRLDDCHLWVAGRVGARALFHGSVDAIIPAENVRPLLQDFLRRLPPKGAPRMALFALVNMARFSGIRGLDLPEDDKEAVRKRLTQENVPPEWIELLENALQRDSDFTAEVVGERLPLGLALN